MSAKDDDKRPIIQTQLPAQLSLLSNQIALFSCEYTQRFLERAFRKCLRCGESRLFSSRDYDKMPLAGKRYPSGG